jgi:hypothetical protein
MLLREEEIRDTEVAARLPATTGWQPVLPDCLLSRVKGCCSTPARCALSQDYDAPHLAVAGCLAAGVPVASAAWRHLRRNLVSAEV